MKGSLRKTHYKQITLGLAKGCESHCSPVLRWIISFVFFATFVFASVCIVFAETVQPEMFLAPNPGVRYIFTDGKGMERRLSFLDRSNNRLSVEEEVCCFQPATGDESPMSNELLPTPKEPYSFKKQYTLFVDEARFMMTSDIGDITFVHFSKGKWTVPSYSSSGLPKEGVCRIVSEKWEYCWGERRLVVVVECVVHMDGEIIHRETWTVASGLGLIALGDFRLSSIENMEETNKFLSH